MESDRDNKELEQAVLRGILMAAVDNSFVVSPQPKIPERMKIVREYNIFNKMCVDLGRIKLSRTTNGSIA